MRRARRVRRCFVLPAAVVALLGVVGCTGSGEQVRAAKESTTSTADEWTLTDPVAIAAEDMTSGRFHVEGIFLGSDIEIVGRFQDWRAEMHTTTAGVPEGTDYLRTGAEFGFVRSGSGRPWVAVRESDMDISWDGFAGDPYMGLFGVLMESQVSGPPKEIEVDGDAVSRYSYTVPAEGLREAGLTDQLNYPTLPDRYWFEDLGRDVADRELAERVERVAEYRRKHTSAQVEADLGADGSLRRATIELDDGRTGYPKCVLLVGWSGPLSATLDHLGERQVIGEPPAEAVVEEPTPDETARWYAADDPRGAELLETSVGPMTRRDLAAVTRDWAYEEVDWTRVVVPADDRDLVALFETALADDRELLRDVADVPQVVVTRVGPRFTADALDAVRWYGDSGPEDSEEDIVARYDALVARGIDPAMPAPEPLTPAERDDVLRDYLKGCPE